MSVMNETAIGLSDLLTQGTKMIAAWREALNDLEALFYLIERASGQRGRQEPVEDDSIAPEDLLQDTAPACDKEKGPSVRRATAEELRPLLAEKARAGYKAEVKKLLAKYGAEKLSDITDAAVLGAMMTEAEGLGCQNTPT